MINISGFPGGSGVKNPPANTGDPRDAGSVSGSGRSPWRRKWQPTPIFLPGKSQGQRSLAGYSPRGRKQLDKSECTHTHTRTQRINFSILQASRYYQKKYCSPARKQWCHVFDLR